MADPPHLANIAFINYEIFEMTRKNQSVGMAPRMLKSGCRPDLFAPFGFFVVDRLDCGPFVELPPAIRL